MVLSSFGVDLPESQLRALCDSTILGTDALKAVDAARQLGFTNSAKYTLTLDELKNLVAAGHYPIVFVSLFPIGCSSANTLIMASVKARPVKGLVAALSPVWFQKSCGLDPILNG
jgi:hypothetical protein